MIRCCIWCNSANTQKRCGCRTSHIERSSFENERIIGIYWARKRSRGVRFLHDNVPVQITAIFKIAITECGLFELDHSPYSPDLAPSNYILFCIKRTMGMKKCQPLFRSILHLKKKIASSLALVHNKWLFYF